MNLELAEQIVNFHSEWKIGLFSTSILLGSFLFTMKSFVIQTIKENIYDTKYHKDKVLQRKKSGAKTEYYGGLKRLALLLKFTIIFAILNSLAQITLSPFSLVWLSLICLLMSLITMILFSIAILVVSQNISDMILVFEKKAIAEERPNTQQVP